MNANFITMMIRRLITQLAAFGIVFTGFCVLLMINRYKGKLKTILAFIPFLSIGISFIISIVLAITNFFIFYSLGKLVEKEQH